MKRTTCQALSSLVQGAPERSGRLDPALALHARTCRLCQAELHAAERMVGLLRGVMGNLEVLPALMAERAVARVDAIAVVPTSPRRWIPLFSAATLVASVTAIVLVAGQLATQPVGEVVRGLLPAAGGTAAQPSPPEVPAPSAVVDGALTVAPCSGDRACRAGAQLSVAEGTTRHVLSDGTILRLNHHTSVSLVTTSPRALEVMEGEVLLDVTRQDGLPPLVVRTPHGTILVTGTRLHVSVMEAATTTDLLRGRMEVESGGERVGLRAGEQAVLRPALPPLRRWAADQPATIEWAEPPLEQPEGERGFGRLSARRPGAKADSERSLRLVEHYVSARIQGQFARTEVEEAFRNDTATTLEGTYSFALPPGARIAGLSLLVDGAWEEGAFVGRERAEKIWAGVMRNATPKKRRRSRVEYIWVPGPWRDPALLTSGAGSTFTLRIFPIEGHSERRVRIAYTEVLPLVGGGRRYVYPLPKQSGGAPAAERFRLEAQVGARAPSSVRSTPYSLAKSEVGGSGIGATRLVAEYRDFRPQGDLVIDVVDPPGAGEVRSWVWGTDAGAGYAALSLRPELPRAPAKSVDVLFVVDTSYGTQATRMERAARIVSQTVSLLERDSRVHVLACATRCRELGPGFRPASSTLSAELGAAIRAIEPLGATWLENAFSTAAEVLERSGARPGRARVVFIGDGVPGMGDRRPDRIARGAAARLAAVPVTAVSLGGVIDDDVLGALAHHTGGSHVNHRSGSSLRSTAYDVARRLRTEALRGATVSLPGGATPITEALGDLWPGDERLVLARLAGAVDGELVLRGRMGGQPWERRWRVPLASASRKGNTFVPRLWAQRQIRALEATGDRAHIERVIALSKEHHVLSNHTALIVLESPAMARAFDVHPSRPAVDWTGREEGSASDGVRVAAKTDGLRKSVESSGAKSGGGVSGVRTSNKGKRGTKREVRVSAFASSARPAGQLSANTISRVVRRHQAQLRRVFERSLKSNPSISGTVRLGFTVGPKGQVIQVSATGQMPSELRRAVERVVARWRFDPPPQGQPVKVVYPILFSSRGGGVARSPSPSPSRARRVLVPPRLGSLRPRRPGRWEKRKRVWFREATIRRHRGTLSHERTRLRKREAGLLEQPNSRDRTQATIRAAIRAGNMATARELAERWQSRDRLDPGVLLALADLAALDGRPARAAELLASALDVDPSDVEAHGQLLRLHATAGRRRAECAHALAIAQLKPTQRSVSAALRCDLADIDLLEGLAKRERRRVERALRKAGSSRRTSATRRKRGALRLDATWKGDEDLDVVVLTPSGRRVSWQGGARHVFADAVLSPGRERLRVSARETGRYQVLVIHRKRSEHQAAPTTGAIRVRIHGQSRRIAFQTDGALARVAEVLVTRASRLERVP